MVNDILAAIADSLAAEYPEATIYDTNVRQNLNVPCFLIDLVNLDTQRRLNKQYASHSDFSVVYIGEGPDDTRQVAELLPIQLATVSHGGHTWEGGNFRVNIEDQENTVTCLVQFFSVVKILEERALMKTLRQNGGIK